MNSLGTWSLQVFLSKAITCVANITVSLLMLAMSSPHAPLNVPYFSFILFASDFSFILYVNKGRGYSLSKGDAIIYVINWVSIDTSLSNHKNSPWMQLNNTLMKMFISTLLRKLGISNKFSIPFSYNPVTYSFGSTMITSDLRFIPVHK
jgi:hypothetical protein